MEPFNRVIVTHGTRTKGKVIDASHASKVRYAQSAKGQDAQWAYVGQDAQWAYVGRNRCFTMFV